MNNAGFIVALVVTVLILGVAGLAKYIGHFEIGKKIEARREAHRIENATGDQALNDPMLRALIACPGCGATGDFDVVNAKTCRCRRCGTEWAV